MGTVSELLVIIVLTIITALLVLLGRKIERPIIPGIMTIAYLLFLIYHSVVLNSLTVERQDLIAVEYHYLAAGFILLLLCFIAFLWIDDIVAKKNNKKSYDDSLSWFWDKI
jgi:hypothetical protein